MSVRTGVIHVDQAYGSGGDGSKDRPFETINAALSAAPNFGSTLYVADGSYPEYVVIGSQFVALTIVGRGNVIINPPTGSAIFINSTRSVCLVNLMPQPQEATSGAYGINVSASVGTRLHRMRVTTASGASATGIRVINSPDTEIEDCIVDGGLANGINIRNASDNSRVFGGHVVGATRGFYNNNGSQNIRVERLALFGSATGVQHESDGLSLDGVRYVNCPTPVNDLGSNLQESGAVLVGAGILSTDHQPIIRDASVDDAQRFSAADIGVTRGVVEGSDEKIQQTLDLTIAEATDG